MQSLRLVAILFCALSAIRLIAQDVALTPLAWAELKDAPDELPAFKSKPKIIFPPELRATPDFGYVARTISLDEKGRNLGGQWARVCLRNEVISILAR